MDEVMAASVAMVLSRWRRRMRTNRHPGSKRTYNKAKARRRDRIARESRRRNRVA